jgi:hypothetical protein
MRMPNVTNSAETLMKVYGVYHLTRLQADKSVKELADGFEKAQSRLKMKLEAYEAAYISAQRALAVRDGEDVALDDTVRRFYNAVLGKCGNNHKSQLFLRYFPDGMAIVVNAPLENELMKVNTIITKLAEEADPDLAGHADSLVAAMNNLQAAMDAHSAAITGEANAYGMVQAEKINWLDSYKLDHRTLAQLYYKEAKKADTYFKPVTKDKKEAEPATPEVPKV